MVQKKTEPAYVFSSKGIWDTVISIMQKLLNGQMQINEEFFLHGDGCSTQRRSLVCKAREEGEGSQSTAVKKWNIYGEAFLPFLTVGWSVGGPDEYWKKRLTRFIWIVAQNWVVATRSVKSWGSGDGFELQLGDEETHCAKCSLPQAVVKGALRNNFQHEKHMSWSNFTPSTKPLFMHWNA